MNTWNYRVLKHPQHPIDIQIGNDEVCLQIYEVHYNEGTPTSYGEPGAVILGETLDDLKWILERMSEALTKPILCAGDKWPQEYTP